MAADIARTSFDTARAYTGVVPQQGRVTLEAEENEERSILADERRRELLEIVGPGGTPDDGYAVSSASGFDLTIGPGTMYVGGMRVELDAPITYGAQPDWLDHDGDPEFVPVPAEGSPGNEHVVLVLNETDVTATEDPVLREVALGGPDGAARTRILQRIHRFATEGTDCAAALDADEQAWAAAGLTFDPDTMQLASNSRLQVEWDPPPEPADPCEPAAMGGYLGAENQTIRVQVAAVDTANGTFDLLWGWDNASFLYRVTPDDSANPVLTLERSPVDDFHRPRAGQAVQVLRAAADLVTTDATVEGYVAALNGEVAVLAAPYDPDTKTVGFPAALPAQYTDADKTPQLYLRVWEALLTGNAPGDELTLAGTGLKVVLTVPGGGLPHAGDFWTIAVRPATPDTVLPARLLRTPQPPDGPRTWACPLAVVGWSGGALELLDDCRVPFDPLVDRQGGECCCTVSARPSDATAHGLQALLDRAVEHRDPHNRTRRVTVCLRPGLYELDQPLLLERKHSYLHLEGCGEGVILAAKAGHEQEFAQGLVVLVHTDNVRISGIELRLPQVQASAGGIRPQQRELKAFQRPLGAVYRGLYVSIGIRPVHCAMLEIDHCLFRFTLGDSETSPEQGGPDERNVFGVGVFAASQCWGLRLERNRFLHEPAHQPDASQGAPVHVLCGLLLVPSLVYRSGSTRAARELPSGALIRSLLTRGRIRDNEFTGLTVAVVAFADLGDLRIEDNVIRDCYGGIWLSSLRAQAFAELGGKFTVAGNLQEGTLLGLRQILLTSTADPVLILLSVIGRTYPLPDEFGVGARERALAEREAAAKPKVEQTQWMQQFIREAVQPFATVQSRTTVGPSAKPAAADQTFALSAAPAAAAPHLLAAQRAHVVLSDFERGAALEGDSHGFELRVTDNDVECAFGDQGQTGPALLVWDTDRTDDGSALVSDNRLSGFGEGPVAVVIRVPEVVANGNLVRNRSGKGLTLALVAAQDVAVTGNIFRGDPLLPTGRPFPSPLDTWLPLNTVRT